MGDSVKTEDVDFYNPNHILKRDPGFYLDDAERASAERQRAVVEDREPDYDTMGATAGVPLTTAAALRDVSLGTELPVDQTLPVAVDETVEEGEADPIVNDGENDLLAFDETPTSSVGE